MFDPKQLLDGLLGTQVPGRSGNTVRHGAGKAIQMAKDNPLAAGALAAVLLGTSTGRSLTGSAVKLGGLAAIGGLAYQAYKNYQAGQNPVAAPAPAGEPVLLPPPTDTPFDPAQAPQGEAEFTLALVRAMIAAAKADGHIDETERARIGDRLKLAGLESEAESFLLNEIDAPLDIGALAAAAHNEEQKVEIYTAARLAIDADTRVERGFLDMLAGRLALPDALIDHIEATVNSAKTPAPTADTGPKIPVGSTVNPKW
jgi:uncharacterized membrane protein YebE (DUF533 family)